MEVEEAKLVERGQRVDWPAKVKRREGESDDAFVV